MRPIDPTVLAFETRQFDGSDKCKPKDAAAVADARARLLRPTKDDHQERTEHQDVTSALFPIATHDLPLRSACGRLESSNDNTRRRHGSMARNVCPKESVSRADEGQERQHDVRSVCPNFSSNDTLRGFSGKADMEWPSREPRGPTHMPIFQKNRTNPFGSLAISL